MLWLKVLAEYKTLKELTTIAADSILIFFIIIFQRK